MATLPATRRFTVHEYYQMADAGILGADDRVELVEGEIVQMSPIGSRHASCVARLNELFVSRFKGRVVVRVQDPVRLDEHSEPQPDLVLAKRRADFYAGGHPGPGDVLLLVEVADTTLPYDRSVKVPLYARAGISEMWLVDLEHDRMETFSRPSSDGYRAIHVYARGDRFTVAAFPETELSLNEVLG